MKVVVDCYGGDYAPKETVLGCLLALEKNPALLLVLTGNEEEIKKLIAESKNKDRIEILDAKEVISNDEAAASAVRTKKNSSLVKAYDYTKNNDVAGMVTCGSTGAVLTGATLILGRIRGISRPALVPLLPTVKGGQVLLIDCGANVDSKPQMLVQFAYLGNAYAQAVLGKENPKIALLSNGTEDKKGNEFTREVFALLKEEKGLNFVGNMEARDILSGEYDVVVADGMYGNIALKALEGTANTILKLIKEEVTKTFFSKIGALLLKPAFKKIRDKVDFNQNGGAPLMGINKILVKAHGASKAQSVYCAINQVIDIDNKELIEKIKQTLPQKVVANAD